MIALTVNLEEEDPRSNGGGRGTLCSLPGTILLLDILKKFNINSTFFASGFFARNAPEVLVRIVSNGHEIGCAGFGPSYKSLSKPEIKADIEKARELLDPFDSIIGFRAPGYDFKPEVLENLEALKFAYDSSLQSARVQGEFDHRLAPLKPFFPLRAGPFVEIPVSGSPRLRVPLTSRMIRIRGAKWLVRSCQALQKENVVPVLSLHSWDLRPTPRAGLPKKMVINSGRPFVESLNYILKNLAGHKFVTLEKMLPKIPKYEALA